MLADFVSRAIDKVRGVNRDGDKRGQGDIVVGRKRTSVTEKLVCSIYCS